MDTFPGTCEIVEEGEVNLKSHSKGGGNYRQNSEIGSSNRERRPPALKLKCKESLEDDLNQLFQTISIRTSTKSLDLDYQPGTSPFRRNALKKPVTMGMPRSPGFGNTEPATLKQALRDLCLSKASENAATKRLSKSTTSPGVSEAGRIKDLYSSVMIEACKPGPSSNSMLEISLVPEESKSNVSENIPQQFQMPKAKLLSQSMPSSPQLNVAAIQYGSVTSMVQSENFSRKVMKKASNLESLSKQKRINIPSSSCLKSDANVDEGAVSVNKHYLVQEESRSLSSEKISHPVQVLEQVSSSQNVLSSPQFREALTQDSAGPSEMQDKCFRASEGCEINCSNDSFPQLNVAEILNDIASASKRVGSSRNVRSSRLGGATEQDTTSVSMVNKECVSAVREVETRTLKTELEAEEKDVPSPTTSCAGSNDSITEQVESGSSSTKLRSKASQTKLARKGRLQSTSSKSIPGNRVIKAPRNTNRSVKPVAKTKTVKKKLKCRSTSSLRTGIKDDNTNSSLDHPSQLVCQRCRCALEEVSEGTAQVSPVFPSAGPSTEVSSTNINPGLSKSGLTPKSYNTVVKAKELKSNKGEFSQSSGSLGEYGSTSTSISDDSNASGSTFGNKPHMSKDVRWEAIHNIRKQHGLLDLRHFNLLKKLGSGDIGTVYLAELIDTNCLFAIKVMDNEFLARRRKMPRAHTERDILRMLDHPFLPTLYAQFTSDNLSCLVMEYCPGGDLHVLRQRQPTRCFSESAARFYVAEVLLALQYLHMLGIVYRDLKPENILVREDGHIMLTDFDLSLRCDVNPTLLKLSSSILEPARISGPYTTSRCIGPFCIEPSCQVSCFSPRFLPATSKTRKARSDLAKHLRSLPQLVAEPTDARSNSFVGTHEYLAPEIIKGEGHGAAVDWWTFGVFLYELLYGKTPFKGPGNEETLANVVLQSLKFPDTPFVSLQARDLIRGLLVKDPETRLGSTKGAAEIKQHPFFEGLNWALIRCAIPPDFPEYYDYESPYAVPYDENSKLSECKATGEHLEFELF